jgi:hypothetical protein
MGVKRDKTRSFAWINHTKSLQVDSFEVAAAVLLMMRRCGLGKERLGEGHVADARPCN